MGKHFKKLNPEEKYISNVFNLSNMICDISIYQSNSTLPELYGVKLFIYLCDKFVKSNFIYQNKYNWLLAEHGYDPGYSTDHGYVSDPLPYGESYGGRRNPNVFPDHDGMFPPTDHVAGVGAGGGNEAQALIALDKANNKPVAFSVRTNVMYDGTLDDDSPVHGCAVR